MQKLTHHNSISGGMMSLSCHSEVRPSTIHAAGDCKFNSDCPRTRTGAPLSAESRSLVSYGCHVVLWRLNKGIGIVTGCPASYVVGDTIVYLQRRERVCVFHILPRPYQINVALFFGRVGFFPWCKKVRSRRINLGPCTETGRVAS